MPTYQYRCADCGKELEVKQSFTDAALTTCPACSGDLRKVFGAAGVVFKGSGFYRTDSRAAAAGGAKSASSDSSSASSSSGSASSSTSSTSASGTGAA